MNIDDVTKPNDILPMNDSQLRPRHSGAWLQLVDMIENMQGFHAVIVQYNQLIYRDGLIAQINNKLTSFLIIDLKQFATFTEFEQQLFELSSVPQLIHIINLESFDEANYQQFLRGINYHRELIAELVSTTLIFWLLEIHVYDLSLQAPDFWAWRELVLDFNLPNNIDNTRWHDDWKVISNMDKQKKQQRIDEIHQYITSNSSDTHDNALRSHGDLLYEQACLYTDIGNYDHAKRVFNKALNLFKDLDDKYTQAKIQRELAEIKYCQGETKQALQVLQEDILPLFIRLDDVKETAITKGKIADILQARGQLDKALDIRQNEQLPVYEKLGDIQAIAITKGQIADILWQQDPIHNKQKVKNYLISALTTFQKMNLPQEQLWIKNYLQKIEGGSLKKLLTKFQSIFLKSNPTEVK